MVILQRRLDEQGLDDVVWKTLSTTDETSRVEMAELALGVIRHDRQVHLQQMAALSLTGEYYLWRLHVDTVLLLRYIRAATVPSQV